RTTVPTAGPLSPWTTTRSPGRGAASPLRGAARKLWGRPTGVSLTETSRGLGGVLTEDTLEIQHEPVRHDFHPGVAIERCQRRVDCRKCAHTTIAAERLREPIEIRPHVGVRQDVGTRPGRQHFDVS